MNYFIKRDTSEYGPYTLADIQKYVASGNILLTDLCRSEGLTDWVPVSQVIGNIPVPAAPQPVAGTVGTYAAPAVSPYPPPPNLHWGICVLLSIVTCGIFSVVWIMNVLVLGSRVIGVKLSEDLVKAFVGATFTNEERHKRRLAKVKALEDKR